MKKNRILLAVAAPLLRDALRVVLAEEPSIEVVGEAADPVDVLVALGVTRANVLIHSWGEESEVRATYSHMFAEFPELTLVGIRPSDEFAYIYRQIDSVDNLVSFLKVTRT